MSNKIVYTCKKCNWQASIVADWADLRPKRCGNSRCLHSFLKNPSDLSTKSPSSAAKAVKSGAWEETSDHAGKKLAQKDAKTIKKDELNGQES